ncbi:MAG: single-stranded DNA-binding protein [Gammaproteobacteria bacterium]|nr:single-stranded DNA-binding protein [Gammaproteobacteria bacterium]
MAGTLNRVEIIGFLGTDAEMRYTASGKAVATLSIATTERWRTSDGAQQESTEWHRCVAWNALAENVAQLTKGSYVRVEGRLQTNRWDDAQTGVTRYRTEIVAQNVLFLDRQRADRAAEDNEHAVASGERPDADLPF